MGFKVQISHKFLMSANLFIWKRAKVAKEYADLPAEEALDYFVTVSMGMPEI